MADIIDDAQELNEQHLEQSLRKFRESRPVAPGEFDGYHCVECGEPVEAPRLALGFWHCIECAKVIELRRRQGVAK